MIFYILFLIILFSLGVIDLYDDYTEGTEFSHQLIEFLFVVTIFEIMRRVWKQYKYQTMEIDHLKELNSKLGQTLRFWQDKSQKILSSMRESIQSQFSNWNFTKSETEVAFLIIRGFSFNQIANLLNKSERTVQKQAGAIYEKSGFGGRIEFVGYFLEEIFTLDDEVSFYD